MRGGISISINITYKPSTLAENSCSVEQYVKSLTSAIDSFLEDHIITSKIYSIEIDEQKVGYFAVHGNSLLTQFYMHKDWLKYAQATFADIINKYKIEAAFVPTCDELMMSMSMDLHTKIEKQAYFFQDMSSIDLNKPCSMNGKFRTAVISDMQVIVEGTGDFFDKLEQRISRGEIFVYLEEEQLLGAGIIEHGVLMHGHTSIGMITCEKYRRKGVGREIIKYLKQWCYQHGTKPIAGCWYYNDNSKKTLEIAGMVTITRLLKIFFNTPVN